MFGDDFIFVYAKSMDSDLDVKLEYVLMVDIMVNWTVYGISSDVPKLKHWHNLMHKLKLCAPNDTCCIFVYVCVMCVCSVHNMNDNILIFRFDIRPLCITGENYNTIIIKSFYHSMWISMVTETKNGHEHARDRKREREKWLPAANRKRKSDAKPARNVMSKTRP